MEENRNISRGLRFKNISSGENSDKDKKNIEVEKTGRVEAKEGGDRGREGEKGRGKGRKDD